MTVQNIFLVGLMAVGKSTVGRQLADALSRPFFDADHEIERRAGAEISWIFDVEGEAGFREREASVIDELTQREGIVLATGGGAILREDNRRHLASRGLVVYLDSPIEKLVARTRRDSKRPLLQGGDPGKILRELKATRGPLYAEVSDHRVMTDQRGAGAVTRKILRLLEKEDNKLTRPNT
jgi:shikimate kinase